MNIQEILNMLDEDIARAEEQQPDNKVMSPQYR